MRRRKQEDSFQNSIGPSTETLSRSDKQDVAVVSNDDDDHHRNGVGNKSTKSSCILTILLLVVRLTGCVLFAYGMYFGQTKLCSHEECDMTYSMRIFLELDMPQSLRMSQYRLLKFIDQRDPRHAQFQSKKQPLEGNDWCLIPEQTVAVLYVPGHGEWERFKTCSRTCQRRV